VCRPRTFAGFGDQTTRTWTGMSILDDRMDWLPRAVVRALRPASPRIGRARLWRVFARWNSRRRQSYPSPNRLSMRWCFQPLRRGTREDHGSASSQTAASAREGLEGRAGREDLEYPPNRSNSSTVGYLVPGHTSSAGGAVLAGDVVGAALPTPVQSARSVRSPRVIATSKPSRLLPVDSTHWTVLEKVDPSSFRLYLFFSVVGACSRYNTPR
jgi:hypothetical protein